MTSVTQPAVADLPPIIAEDVERICARTADGLRVLAGRTVLIAGGAGFLPSYFVHTLAYANQHVLDRPCTIVCLDNLLTGLADRLGYLHGRPDIQFMAHDITQAFDLGRQVDYIVHGASIASPTWYRQHPLETIDVNVTGTRRLLDLAKEREAAGFLYLSSSEIYGDPPPERVPTSEDYWGHVSSTGPRACYDESKRLAETLCMTYFRQFATPVKLVRPFNVYGPGLRLDDGRVVPDFLRDALEGRQVTLYSNGRVTRSFCYIADAIAAMLLVLVSGTAGEAYNVGNDEEVTIQQLAEVVDEVSGNKKGLRFAVSEDPAYLTDNPNRRSPDLRKLKALIDWSPQVSLREGISRTYRHYEKQVNA